MISLAPSQLHTRHSETLRCGENTYNKTKNNKKTLAENFYHRKVYYKHLLQTRSRGNFTIFAHESKTVQISLVNTVQSKTPLIL